MVGLGAILEFGGSLLDKLIPDKEAARKAKAKLASMAMEGKLKELESKASIITAEAKSEHWVVAAWRPLIMLMFGLIIFNNYIVSPYAQAMFDISVHLDLPPQMWDLLKLGIGGYIVGRSAEKGIKEFKKRPTQTNEPTSKAEDFTIP